MESIGSYPVRQLYFIRHARFRLRPQSLLQPGGIRPALHRWHLEDADPLAPEPGDDALRRTEKALPHITHKMLSSQLRELEQHGLVARKVFAQVPPKVEYSITAKGKRTIPLITAIRKYGLEMMKRRVLILRRMALPAKEKSEG